MLKNITLSAEESLIKKARKQAAASRTTLNALFRTWLELYASHSTSTGEYEKLMKNLSYAKPGRKFSREEMNER